MNAFTWMRTRKIIGLTALGLLIMGSLLFGLQAAQASPAAQTKEESDGTTSIYRGLSPVVKFDVSPPLRDIAPVEISIPKGYEFPELPSGLEGPLGPQDIDPVVQTSIDGPQAIPTPSISFNGPPNVYNVSPPDPVGDVGPNHYVAMSNLSFQVFNKSGTSLLGPLANNTLWAGFGGDCETDNSGDPIVVYDQLADRWFLTQFTASGPTYFNCCGSLHLRRPDRRILPLRDQHRHQLPGLPQVRRLARRAVYQHAVNSPEPISLEWARTQSTAPN